MSDVKCLRNSWISQTRCASHWHLLTSSNWRLAQYINVWPYRRLTESCMTTTKEDVDMGKKGTTPANASTHSLTLGHQHKDWLSSGWAHRWERERNVMAVGWRDSTGQSEPAHVTRRQRRNQSRPCRNGMWRGESVGRNTTMKHLLT